MSKQPLKTARFGRQGIHKKDTGLQDEGKRSRLEGTAVTDQIKLSVAQRQISASAQTRA